MYNEFDSSNENFTRERERGTVDTVAVFLPLSAKLKIFFSYCKNHPLSTAKQTILRPRFTRLSCIFQGGKILRNVDISDGEASHVSLGRKSTTV